MLCSLFGMRGSLFGMRGSLFGNRSSLFQNRSSLFWNRSSLFWKCSSLFWKCVSLFSTMSALLRTLVADFKTQTTRKDERHEHFFIKSTFRKAILFLFHKKTSCFSSFRVVCVKDYAFLRRESIPRLPTPARSIIHVAGSGTSLSPDMGVMFTQRPYMPDEAGFSR